MIELVNQWLEPVLSDKQGISCEPKVPKKSKGKVCLKRLCIIVFEFLYRML